MKDVNYTLLPQDPILDFKFPRPVVERGYCYGKWQAVDESRTDESGDVKNRDCNSGHYSQPLSGVDSTVSCTFCKHLKALTIVNSDHVT